MRAHGKHTKPMSLLKSGTEVSKTLDSRAFSLVEALRPFRVWLSQRDFWHLQHLRQQCGSIDGGVYPLLSHLARAKLQDARLIDLSEGTEGIASVDSRVTYSINGTSPQSRVLFHEGYAEGQGGIPLKSLLGVTLLGMKSGHTTSLIRADGTTETLKLVDVPWRREQMLLTKH